MSSIISLRGNGVIGISYGEMDLLKSSLKVARDKSVEVSRQVNRARTNIKIDRSSYRAKIAEDELSRIYREASKNQQDLNRVISNVEYAIKSFKRTDEQCAARIRLIGHGYEVENKIDGFLEGVKSLWNSGKEAFFKMSDSAEEWMDRHPLIVNIVCLVGDGLIFGATVAEVIASGGAALGSPITWATLADSGNSFIDRAVKIYNNISNGSNKGFNLLETSSKWALGDDLGGIVYDSYENIMMVSSLASLGKGALKLGKKIPGLVKSGGDLIKNGGKIFDKLKDIGKIGLESIISTFSNFKTNITKAGKGIEKSVNQFKNVNKESHFLLDPKGNRIPLNENGEIIKDGKGFYEKFKGLLDGSLKVESKVVETADGRRINAGLHIVENEKKAIDSIKFNKIDEGKAVGNIEGVGEAKDYEKYSTLIDSKVKEVEKAYLPNTLSKTFTDSNYRTVITEDKIIVYRTFGGRADAGGSFVTTISAESRIQAKIDTALLPSWGNSRMYEAVIEVPKGEILNIGKVAEQATESGSKLVGGGDQVVLPLDWSLNWIKEIRLVPSK